VNFEHTAFLSKSAINPRTNCNDFIQSLGRRIPKIILEKIAPSLEENFPRKIFFEIVFEKLILERIFNGWNYKKLCLN